MGTETWNRTDVVTDIGLSDRPDLRHLSVVADGPDDFVVGNGARFINVPEIAATIVRMLDGNCSILEATVRIHNDRGTDVEVQQFVRALDGQGLLTPAPGGGTLAWLPPRVAGLAFNPVVYALVLAVYTSAAVGVLTHRIALPGFKAVLWSQSPTLSELSFAATAVLLLLFHEISHVVAARSLGVSAHLSLSTRMWFLVAQTRVTGIWGVERSRRYRAHLAGMGWDSLTTSIALLATMFAGPGLRSFLDMVVLITAAQIAWEFMFFMKTDIYYALANFLRCKNLMADATNFLRIRLHDHTRSAATPRKIRWYAYFIVLGRLGAVGFLWGYTLPLDWVVAHRGLTLVATGRFPSVADGVTSLALLGTSWVVFGVVFLRRRLHRGAEGRP